MAGQSKGDLSPPPMSENAGSFELLRVWSQPGGQQQVVLQIAWEDPGAWGLLIVDVARHAAKAYAKQGIPERQALDRILSLFRAEIASPTDTPIDVSSGSRGN